MVVRTPLTPINLASGQTGADAAEALTAIDHANGMVVQTSNNAARVLLRVTNSAGEPHAVTIVSPELTSEADLVITAVPATTGVRYIGVGNRYFQTDNTILLNFDAGFTGFITALEVA